MFTVDHTKAKGIEEVKPGEYEVTVVHYDQTTSQNGNPRIIVNYEIRSDVDQPCQGREIKYDNFVVTENSMWRLHAASKAAGFPTGMGFKSYKEWADTLLNKPLRLIVGEREYKGKKYPQVNGFKLSEVAPPQSIEISDSDIPF
ncbi:DUF669 domain-containing protein [Bacillus toyonensis]|uniref:DUF669 domain-containing protein n=1 Tax=Bacillus toyonensis TaxID=155322 RepID=UPI000BF194A3|nr:DUF669 domain-containing protein [Bacillus toyonensis]PEK87940.1 hypothetical protein CN594_08440 [Bacillus toyonensis]PFY37720.1 hypothetical protein COL54_23735 [Bacillus toyonensis]PFY50032.1 hypothetical protein COL55_11240 [Bacillus toyonensis]PFY67848.1 hypothetical protein COL62_26650 [Bacillus toyonensis]PGD12582.1 hypothetical protein COM37_28450 [Bacillus toyonensis]